MKRFLFSVLFICLFFLNACTSSRSGEVYSRDQARSAQTVQLGVVEFVKNVQIEGTQSGVGMAAGGVAGGVAGSTIGHGRGSTLAAVGGALLGAVAGNVGEEAVTRRAGLEITVRLDSGAVIAVAQEADVPFHAGERVRVLTGVDGAVRIEK